MFCCFFRWCKNCLAINYYSYSCVWEINAASHFGSENLYEIHLCNESVCKPLTTSFKPYENSKYELIVINIDCMDSDVYLMIHP